MTVHDFYTALGLALEKYPHVKDLPVKIEYPAENGVSGLLDLESMEWDEADFILSYIDFEDTQPIKLEELDFRPFDVEW